MTSTEKQYSSDLPHREPLLKRYWKKKNIKVSMRERWHGKLRDICFSFHDREITLFWVYHTEPLWRRLTKLEVWEREAAWIVNMAFELFQLVTWPAQRSNTVQVYHTENLYWSDTEKKIYIYISLRKRWEAEFYGRLMLFPSRRRKWPYSLYTGYCCEKDAQMQERDETRRTTWGLFCFFSLHMA